MKQIPSILSSGVQVHFATENGESGFQCATTPPNQSSPAKCLGCIIYVL